MMSVKEFVKLLDIKKLILKIDYIPWGIVNGKTLCMSVFKAVEIFSYHLRAPMT